MAERASTAAFEDAVTQEFETDTGVIAYDILGATDSVTDDVIDDATDGTASKPWITLIHNFMSTGRTAWGQIAPRLAATHRVLVPDLPGHGRSQGYPQGFDYRHMARQIGQLMEHAGAARGDLAGCSAGGMIAQWLVAEAWATPTTLTLISTTHSMDPDTAGAPVTTDPDRFQFGNKWIEATAALHDKIHGEGYFRREILSVAGKQDPETALNLPLDALADWSMPVCIIHGEEDEFFPVVVARNMASHLPTAQLHIIPGQSHSLIFRQGWKVADIMLEFLAEAHT